MRSMWYAIRMKLISDMLRNMSTVNFMSNIDKHNRGAAEQAAKETNTPIVIKDEATDIWGNILPGCVAVYATSNADHGKFWRRFRELRLTTYTNA